MIAYQVPCLICKKTYSVGEKDPEFQRIKRNYEGKHVCPDCKTQIEQSAKLMKA